MYLLWCDGSWWEGSLGFQPCHLQSRGCSFPTNIPQNRSLWALFARSGSCPRHQKKGHDLKHPSETAKSLLILFPAVCGWSQLVRTQCVCTCSQICFWGYILCSTSLLLFGWSTDFLVVSNHPISKQTNPSFVIYRYTVVDMPKICKHDM